MRSIPDSQAIALIAIMSLLTFFVRGLPFLLFSWKIQDTCLHHVPRKSTSLRYHRYAGVYCFKNVSLLQTPFGLPELIAGIAIVLVHCWKKNTLLSVGGGTLFYMFLVQIIFK